MDQTGYPGVDENTFLLAAHGKSPAGETAPGITTDSLAGSSTAGFGRTQSEGGTSSGASTRRKTPTKK